jgi:hypothetical protein
MHEVESREVTVAEMQHRFIAVHEMDQVKVAAAVINSSNKTIVFTKTRWGADKLAAKLLQEDVNAAAIHGDLRQSQRERALKDFMKGPIRTFVATDVAARGIHVDDVEATKVLIFPFMKSFNALSRCDCLRSPWIAAALTSSCKSLAANLSAPHRVLLKTIVLLEEFMIAAATFTWSIS